MALQDTFEEANVESLTFKSVRQRSWMIWIKKIVLSIKKVVLIGLMYMSSFFEHHLRLSFNLETLLLLVFLTTL